MKVKSKILYKILLIVLPTSILPLAIIMSLISLRISGYLQKQSDGFYSTIVNQISLNFESVYNTHAQALSNMMRLGTITDALSSGNYKNEEDEEAVTKKILGAGKNSLGLRNVVEEKIEGYCVLYQSGRKSIISKRSYSSFAWPPDIKLPNYDKLINDNLFKELSFKRKTAFGVLSHGVLKDNGDNADVPAMLFAFYPQGGDESSFNVFIFVGLNKDFMEKFYINVKGLQFGTLYILDKSNKVITTNHNNDKTYKDYKSRITEYLKKTEDYQILSKSDFSLLNVDPSIIQDEKIKGYLASISGTKTEASNKKNFLSKISSMFSKIMGFNKHIVRFHGKQFLVVSSYRNVSQTKFIYFYPMKHVQKPIFDILFILFIIAIFVIVVTAVLTIAFSRTFTRPVGQLVKITQEIATGDYNHLINVESKDELGNLGRSFNKMIHDIKQYQDKLLTVEKEKSELELASRIQTCLLPPIPITKNYDITALMLPSADVGGDYYDIISEDEERVWFAIGDVSGRGLVSGLIMMMAQTAVNTILLKNPDVPTTDLLIQVNKVLYQNVKRLGQDDYMTLSFLVAEKGGTIKCTGAHLDILVYRDKEKKVEIIESKGMWIGLKDEISDFAKQTTFKLQKNDVMFLYTDGLIESKSKEGEQFDKDRLITFLVNNAEEHVKDIEEILIKEVFDFIDVQQDDITFVIVKKK